MLAVLLALTISAQQAPQSAETVIEKQEVPREHPEGHTRAPEQPTRQPIAPSNEPISSASRPMDPGQQESRNGQPGEDWVDRLRTDPVATFTMLLFVATVLLWWATRRLVKGAEDTAERELRAYLFTDSAKIASPPSNQGGSITLVLKNFGLTPVYNYTLSWGVRVVSAIPGGVAPDVPEVTPSDQLRGPLPPGATHSLRPPLPVLTDDELGELASGKKLLYAYGKIVYKDAFGKRRFTKFCYAWGGIYGSGVGHLAFADKGNEAD